MPINSGEDEIRTEEPQNVNTNKREKRKEWESKLRDKAKRLKLNLAIE